MVAMRTFNTVLLPMAIGAAALLTGCGQGATPKGSTSAASVEKSTATSAPSKGPSSAKETPEVPNKPSEPAESKAARAAFDKLIKAERDEDPQAWMAADQELTAIGKDAAGVLRKGLSSADLRTREFAAMLLARLGPDAAVAEHELIKALGDDSPMVRANAGASLSLIGSQPALVIPLLQKLLKEENPTIRKISLYSLGNYGSQGDAAVPAIASFLNHTDPELRMAAVVTLGNIGPKARGEVSRLELLLKDESSEVAPAARAALARINAVEARSETAETASPFQKFVAETAAFATPAPLLPQNQTPATLSDDEPAEAELSEPTKSSRGPAGEVRSLAPQSGGPSLLGPGAPSSKE